MCVPCITDKFLKPVTLHNPSTRSALIVCEQLARVVAKGASRTRRRLQVVFGNGEGDAEALLFQENASEDAPAKAQPRNRRQESNNGDRGGVNLIRWIA